VVGWDRSVDYDKLRTASLLVERGARLVATNPDTSYPAPDGLWPGAGAILAAITATTRATPTIVGKPARPMFESAIEHTAARSPLVVGDRLDTDVAGAAAMGLDSLLVLSGASRPSDLLGPHLAPTYVGDSVSALLEEVPPARFRPAGPQDVEAVSTLLERSGLSATGLERRLAETLVCPLPPRTGPDKATPNPPGAAGNAASDTEAIAATVCVEQLGGFGLLRSLAVRKDVRRKGLGVLAVAAGVRMARHRGLRAMALLTETAAPFFEALGFRSVPRAELPRAIATSSQAAEECAESATAMLLEL
jgi:GNAT superfamily N-acetyltransferase